MFKSKSRKQYQLMEAVEKIFGVAVVLIYLLQVVSRTSVTCLTYLHYRTVHFITSGITQLLWFLCQHASTQQIWERFVYLIQTYKITSGQDRWSLQKVLITLLALSQWSLVWVQSSGNTIQVMQFKYVANIKQWLKLKNLPQDWRTLSNNDFSYSTS